MSTKRTTMKFHLKQIAFSVALGASMLYGPPQATAQHIRADRLSLAVGTGIGMAANRNELDGISVNFDFVPTGSVNYLKNLNPFLDIRLGAGIQGLIFDGSQLQEHSGTATGDSPGNGFSIFTEIAPLYVTNPNRLGYLPANFLFHIGTGIGLTRSFVKEHNFAELTENDLAKAKFGFDSPLQKLSSRSNFYVPIILGIEENKTKRSWRFGAEVTGNLLLVSESMTTSNVFPGWFQFKITVTKSRSR